MVANTIFCLADRNVQLVMIVEKISVGARTTGQLVVCDNPAFKELFKVEEKQILRWRQLSPPAQEERTRRHFRSTHFSISPVTVACETYKTLLLPRIHCIPAASLTTWTLSKRCSANFGMILSCVNLCNFWVYELISKRDGCVLHGFIFSIC